MARLLVSFAATVGIAVPAAWHVLDADIERDGKALRPLQHEFTADGMRVTIDVDRKVVTTGDTVTATLVAYSPTTKIVAIDLTALETPVEEFVRVEPPETVLSHEQVTLTATPTGGAPVTVHVKLGRHGRQLARTERYRLYIAPHGEKPPMVTDFGDRRPDWSASNERAAGVDLTGWSGSSLGMTIVAETPIVVDQPYTIAVHVTNTTKADLPNAPNVNLDSGDDLDATDRGVEITALDIDSRDDDETDVPFPRGAEMIRRYRVTPRLGQKQLPLVVTATAYDTRGAGTIAGGAMDIATFAVADAVASK